MKEGKGTKKKPIELFDGDSSDSESKIKTENEYAKKYDDWRKKEELHKLKAKYGETELDGASSSSSEDDEEAAELTEEAEKDFFRTLSCLKSRNPKIYDNNVSFFKEKEDSNQKKKTKRDASFTIKDYEREVVFQTKGKMEDDDVPFNSTSHKSDAKSILFNDEENSSDDEGELFQIRQKDKDDATEEAEYKKWLAGKSDDLEDNEMKADLNPLKQYWDDPNLSEDEKFLRDYILRKRYLNKEDDEYIPTYEEIIHDSDGGLSDDEKAIENQEEFEHKYNFRFEEPDQEFIKRYPRTIEKSLRKTDDRRKIKRAETKARKQKEKEEKMAEIKKLKELKQKEIEEKIDKLKEIIGNDDMKFQGDDLEGDFNPGDHDRRMKELFNSEFYDRAEEDQKPEFPDIDEELEIENWERYNEHENIDQPQDEIHCEDEEFNMDADYDPSSQRGDSEKANKRKRKRKSKVAEVLQKPKPKYDPSNRNYEKYFDEYYNLDCEDVIGDIPCRFKYREVVPNDFGLTVEEILLAKDRELNKWCSVKKAIQYRQEHVEKYDQIAYSKKAKNIALKRKILPSLFAENESTSNDIKETEVHIDKTIKILKKNRNKESCESNPENNVQNKLDNNSGNVSGKNSAEKKKKKKGSEANKKNLTGTENMNKNQKIISKKVSPSNKNMKKRKLKESKEFDIGISDNRLSAYGINPKRFKNKLKYKH